MKYWRAWLFSTTSRPSIVLGSPYSLEQHIRVIRGVAKMIGLDHPSIMTGDRPYLWNREMLLRA